jgi:TolA-binding protein
MFSRGDQAPAPAGRALAGSLLCALLGLPLALGTGAARADDAPAAPASKDTVRPELGPPLTAAIALIKDKKYKEALAKIHEADAIPNLTPFEKYTIERMRLSAAASSGDTDLAASSAEAVIATGRLAPAEQLKMVATAGQLYMSVKNYPKAIALFSRYIKEGGTDPAAQENIITAYYLSNDFPSTINELKNVVEADEKAGRPTSELHLKLLLSSYQKTNNAAGLSSTLEKLLETYPKKEYWEQALSHLVHKAGFSDRLELDLYRLELALDELKREGDFVNFAQLCLEAGFPTEAKKVVDKGYAAGILGKGPEAERHKRLQAKADKDAADDAKALGSGDVDAEKAKTGDGLVNAGYNYVINGKFDRGLALIQQGIQKGGLRHPEDSRLHLGIAYYLAGDKAKAVQTLHAVSGNDGVGDLAHLWAIHIAHS